MDMGRREDRMRSMARVTWKLTLPCVKHRANGNFRVFFPSYCSFLEVFVYFFLIFHVCLTYSVFPLPYGIHAITVLIIRTVMFCEHRISKNGTTIPGENTGLVFCELLITLCQLIKIQSYFMCVSI